MQKYYLELNSKGFEYLKNPKRNSNGRINTTYFKKTIILYILREGKYKPSKFKEFITNLNVLKNKDMDLMNKRPYKEWKHLVDAGKQNLLKAKVIKENQDKSFSIVFSKTNQEFNKYHSYFDIKIL